VTEKHFILATAGHVDHGKSALVKALTGTDPDRLPEEKARKITIDLGFAHLKLASPDDPDMRFSVGIIDVPGHEDFVKNMVAGVGSIDLALLVVAADDGWMAQTEEHFRIFTHLGVRRAVVALTKIDLAAAEEVVEREVREQLRDSPFADAPIIKTSVLSGCGFDQLKTQMAREFCSLPPLRDIGKPRLFVDRAFSLRGVGTVVTGTVTGGAFARGNPVLVQPRGEQSKIRSAQNHNRDVERVGPGMRAAFALSDIAVATPGKDGVKRGDVITRIGLGSPDKNVDLLLERSPRTGSKGRALTNGTRVRAHHGSGSFSARVFLQKPNSSDQEETALVRLRFDTPVFFFAGDRLILRDSSERATIAGAVVLDPSATPIRFRSEAQREFLQMRAQAPDDAAVFVSTQLRRDYAVKRPSLLLQSRFSEAEIVAAVNNLAKSGELILLGEIAVETNWWGKVRARAIKFIDAEHAAHPEQTGIALSKLKSELVSMLPMPEIFELLVAELNRDGFIRHGDALRRASHRPTLPPELQTAAARIRSVLVAPNVDPPSRVQLAPDPVSQQALRFLRSSGEVVELNGDIVLVTERFEKMRDSIIAFLRKNNSATTSQLRQLLGTSRRVIIPFLERLDRDGVTRRIADKRVLAKGSRS
jgi:selenocysteine-specific elongation factor